MSIKNRLKETKFSDTEKQAVDFILAHPHELHGQTLKVLAENSYTSPATFVRLAKKLGYSGWLDFLADFLKEFEYFEGGNSEVDLNIPFDNTDNVLQIANKITEIKIEAMKDSLSLLTYKELMEATDIIRSAQEIKIFASSVNMLLAEEFAFKMNRIKKRVSISSVEGEHIYDVLNLDKTAAAIIISYSGSSEKMSEIMALLSSRQVPSIAITSLTDNVLTEKADVILYMSTREKLFSKIGQYSSNTSILHILDILYSTYFARDFNQNLETTLISSRIANHRMATADPMIENDE